MAQYHNDINMNETSRVVTTASRTISALLLSILYRYYYTVNLVNPRQQQRQADRHNADTMTENHQTFYSLEILGST